MSSERIGREDALGQLPQALQMLMTLERFHLHRPDFFQKQSINPEFDERYLPQNCGAFALPCFWVLRKHLYVYGRQAAAANELKLFDGSDSQERVLFPIHPLALDYYRDFLVKVRAQNAAADGIRTWAVPTSSTRTLLVWPDGAPEQAVFAKTTLPCSTFGDRRLYLRKVACSIGLAKLVCDSAGLLPPDLGYFDEPVGFVPRRLQDAGVVIRSIPEQIKNNDLVVAPLFSLWGGAPGRVPLLLTILERSGLDLERFLEEVFCAQFATLWLKMSLQQGLILEAHGQDLLLGLSPQLMPTGRFYYRDFEGLQVDWELRRVRGLPHPSSMPHAWSWYETYSTWGNRQGALVWSKLETSLFDYLYFVLRELDSCLSDWQKCGLVSGRGLGENFVSMTFSRYLIAAVGEMFGTRMKAEFNIADSLKSFILSLMKLRACVISTGSAS